MTTTQEHIAAALSAIASAQVTASQDAVDHANALDQITALSAVIVEQRAALVDRDARIVALQARLDELEGDDPPPPPPVNMLVGASVQQRELPNGQLEPWPQSLARFESTIGKKVQVVRRFTRGIPTRTSAVFQGLTGYDRVFSFKGNADIDQLVDWFESFPRDGRTTFVASWHEPEKDLTRDQFLVRQAILEQAIVKSGRDDIQKTIIVMGWWDRDASPTTTSATFYPDDLSDWVVGFDVYDRLQKDELVDSVTPSLDEIYERGCTRWMLTECATKRKGQAAADWIERALPWAESAGCIRFCWFDSDQGDDQGTPLGEGFYLDLRGPEAVAAFASFIN